MSVPPRTLKGDALSKDMGPPARRFREHLPHRPQSARLPRPCPAECLRARRRRPTGRAADRPRARPRKDFFFTECEGPCEVVGVVSAHAPALLRSCQAADRSPLHVHHPAHPSILHPQPFHPSGHLTSLPIPKHACVHPTYPKQIKAVPKTHLQTLQTYRKTINSRRKVTRPPRGLGESCTSRVPASNEFISYQWP